MTLREFAESIINDPAYRETVRQRAHAGTLPPDVESMLWEIVEMADGSLPPLASDIGRAPVQGPTLALVRRPSAAVEVDHE